MAFTTDFTYQITVEDNGIILIRQSKRVFEDGVLLAERFHRTSFEPGDDVSTQPMRVQRIAQAVWTQAVIDAYRAAKAAQLPR